MFKHGVIKHYGCSALIVGVSLVIVPLTGSAETGFTEDDLLGDIPMISAVSRFEQRIDQAPASVTIIDRELIALSGAQTIVDLFRLAPGFQSYYVSGNRYGASYHGIGKEFPNQMEVMVDGRSVYESLFSSVHWSTLGIELSDIDHIEIVRGSNAPAQGSNAFLGSINIVTRKPIQDSGLGLEVTAGDWQTRNGSLRYNDSLGALDYRIGLGYQNNEGFPAVAGGELDDGHELGYARLQATYTPSLLDTIDVAAGFTRENTGWGDSDHPDEYDTARAYSDYQSATWSRTLDADNELEFQLYHNHFRINNWLPLGNFYQFLGIDDDTASFLTSFDELPAAVAAQIANEFQIPENYVQRVVNQFNTPVYNGFGRLISERYDAQIQHNIVFSEKLRGTWGFGLRNESLDAFHPQSIDLDVDESTARFFAHGQWQPVQRLTINGGTMVEDSPQGLLVSPRVSANYHIFPSQTLRLAYVLGNRAPSLLEANEHLSTHVGDVVLDTVRIADPNMTEERLDSVELGYLVQLDNPRLSMDIRLFQEHISDAIDEYSEFNIPENTYFGDLTHKKLANNGSWDITGGEIQLAYRPADETLIRLHYSNTDLDTPPNVNIFAPDAIAPDKGDRMATHTAGLLVGQHFANGWTASAMVYHQSAVRWEDGDTMDGFSRVDARLSYRFEIGGARGAVSLIAQNLGADYEEFNDNNHFTTRYFLTVQMAMPQ